MLTLGPPSVGYGAAMELDHENYPDNRVASGKHIHNTYRVIVHFQSTRIEGDENYPDARVCLVKSCKVLAETDLFPPWFLHLSPLSNLSLASTY